MAVDPITVMFTQADAEEIQTITNARCHGKLSINSRRRDPNYTDALVERMGVIGEYAFEKVSGIPMNREGLLGGDGGIDFELPGLGTLGTKFNHRQNGYLVVEEYDGDQGRLQLKDFMTDAIVLIDGICDPPRMCSCRIAEWWRRPVRVVGWVEQKEFLMRSQWVNWGNGPRWYVRQKVLRDVHELIGSPSMA